MDSKERTVVPLPYSVCVDGGRAVGGYAIKAILVDICYVGGEVVARE
jgi:hypothetical protein